MSEETIIERWLGYIPPVVGACALALALCLTGCASQPIEAQLATACNQIATAYTEAAILKAGGKLSATQIAAINATIPVAIQACDPSNPPTDINAAILSLTTALQTVTLAQAGVH